MRKKCSLENSPSRRNSCTTRFICHSICRIYKGMMMQKTKGLFSAILSHFNRDIVPFAIPSPSLSQSFSTYCVASSTSEFLSLRLFRSLLSSRKYSSFGEPPDGHYTSLNNLRDNPGATKKVSPYIKKIISIHHHHVTIPDGIYWYLLFCSHHILPGTPTWSRHRL